MILFKSFYETYSEVAYCHTEVPIHFCDSCFISISYFPFSQHKNVTSHFRIREFANKKKLKKYKDNAINVSTIYVLHELNNIRCIKFFTYSSFPCFI